jgi:hypothetical protein
MEGIYYYGYMTDFYFLSIQRTENHYFLGNVLKLKKLIFIEAPEKLEIFVDKKPSLSVI